MELTGVALRRSLASAYPTVLRGRRRNPARVCCANRGGGGFADEGHLRYYEAPSRKAVEAVAGGLAKLRAMGIVAGDAAKEKVLSEATDLLLQELNQLRDEEDELKKKMKDEKAAVKALKQQQKEAKKATAAAAAMNCDDGSSSESSESECEDQTMELELSCVATATVSQIGEGIAISTKVPQIVASDMAATTMEYDKAAMKAMKKREKEQKKAAKIAMKMKKEKKMATLTCCKDEDSSSCSSESSDSECEEVVRMSRCATMITLQTQPSSTVFPIILPQIPESVALEPCQDAQISSEPANSMQSTTSSSIAVAEKPMVNRIEVCMGGKCKKSGSLMLLQEFEKKVGTHGAVVGCKCLGKCGLGPNIRLRSQGSMQKNPLCIGVGLEDVGTIVAGLFGDDDMGMMN
ncbi:hypothetical protein ABZP36_029214 [Zizania latifolia]